MKHINQLQESLRIGNAGRRQDAWSEIQFLNFNHRRMIQNIQTAESKQCLVSSGFF